VACADLGGLGSNESEAAICPIGWQFPLVESLPWVLFAGALLIDRRSKRSNGWLVLAVGGGLLSIWALARVLTFVPTDLSQVARPAFQALLYGLAMTCLLSVRLASSTGRQTFFKMLLVMGIASAITLYGLIDIDDERIFVPSIVTLLILFAAALAALTVASWAYRRCSNLTVFVGSLTLGGFISVFAIISLSMLASRSPVPWHLVLAVAGVLSAVFSLVLLPLVLVLFYQPAQRPRLSELHILPVAGRGTLPKTA
jgi:hypothetical protein